MIRPVPEDGRGKGEVEVLGLFHDGLEPAKLALQDFPGVAVKLAEGVQQGDLVILGQALLDEVHDLPGQELALIGQGVELRLVAELLIEEALLECATAAKAAQKLGATEAVAAACEELSR